MIASRPRRLLVLGGVRSGKSRFAESLACQMGEPIVYLATGVATDAEMAERIRLHREQRSPAWTTVEEPLRPADAVAELDQDVSILLIEDLGTLLTNHLVAFQTGSRSGGDAAALAEEAAWHQTERLLVGGWNVVLVSNEVGMGVVPPHPVGRIFRDSLGRLNQRAAERADEVFLLVAGIPVRIKPAAG